MRVVGRAENYGGARFAAPRKRSTPIPLQSCRVGLQSLPSSPETARASKNRQNHPNAIDTHPEEGPPTLSAPFALALRSRQRPGRAFSPNSLHFSYPLPLRAALSTLSPASPVLHTPRQRDKHRNHSRDSTSHLLSRPKTIPFGPGKSSPRPTLFRYLPNPPSCQTNTTRSCPPPKLVFSTRRTHHLLRSIPFEMHSR